MKPFKYFFIGIALLLGIALVTTIVFSIYNYKDPYFVMFMGVAMGYGILVFLIMTMFYWLIVPLFFRAWFKRYYWQWIVILLLFSLPLLYFIR